MSRASSKLTLVNKPLLGLVERGVQVVLVCVSGSRGKIRFHGGGGNGGLERWGKGTAPKCPAPKAETMVQLIRATGASE